MEKPIVFSYRQDYMYGVLHLPEFQALESLNTKGVLIVVGGPQYRVGSHRQFLLLARKLADSGIPVMRFDYRSMGDSHGESRSFESVDEDIKLAIDKFMFEVPMIKEIVLWGLCDAASASLMYAPIDQRVRGLVLLNPWVRTESSLAKTYLKHYYTARLVDKELWIKIARGQLNLKSVLISLYEIVKSIFGINKKQNNSSRLKKSSSQALAPFPERMLNSFSKFNGRTLFILSGDDLTAAEFRDHAKGSSQWRKLLKREKVEWRELAEANHTFSTRQWRAQVEDWTQDWLKTW